MSELLTMQDLANGHLDVKALGEAANGDENTIVTTRTGNTYPSAERAINIMFKNGGLPAKPFPTLAKMQTEGVVLGDGDYAQVTDDTVNNGLYVKTAGVWVKSEYDPLTRAITYTDSKTKKLDDLTYIDKYAWAISDGTGKTAIAVNNEGGIEAADIDTGTLKIGETQSDNSGDFAWGITDSAGKTAIAVLHDGSVRLASLDTKELKLDGKDVNFIAGKVRQLGSYPANLNHFEVYGQSLSQGAYSLPIQTTTQKYDSLMFTGGIRPQHPSYDVPNFYADFIPLIEKSDISGYVGGETPCGGATDAVKQLIKDENGIAFEQQQYQLLGTACGEGGMGIDSLTTTFYDSNLQPAITNAFNLAQAKGMTYAMPLMGWVQGEEDNKPSKGTTIAAYQTKLEALRLKVDAHLKTLNAGLSLDGFIVGQLCSFKTSGRTEPHIELAIYEASIKTDNNVYLACPFYIFDYKDGYHVDGVSSKWMGAYLGLVYKRVVVDKERWLPVHPISHVKQGRILEVKFHVPVQPLVFDVNHVALNANYGFTLVDANNNPIAINSVTLTQGDTVKFTTDTAIPDGAKLRYAWTPIASPNRNTGPRGNLRDSQGNDIVFDPQGINKPMHNWTPIFEYGV